MRVNTDGRGNGSACDRCGKLQTPKETIKVRLSRLSNDVFDRYDLCDDCFADFKNWINWEG